MLTFSEAPRREPPAASWMAISLPPIVPPRKALHGAAPMVARLRLEDESEVAIQIIVVESDLAEFEAPLTASEADLLLARR